MIETVKKYLEGKVSDDNQIKDFLETNESEIKAFFVELWEMQFAKPAEETPIEKQEVPVDQIPIENPQTEKQDAPVEQIPTENPQTEKQEIKDMKFGADSPPDKEQAKQETLALQIKNKQIIMPNGKKGKEYVCPFNIETIGLPDITSFHFENLPEGISFSTEENKITGTPVEAGDFKVLLHCASKDGRKAIKEVLLIINPDPRELWSKNIPTPEDIEYYKDDSDSNFVSVKSKLVKNGILGLSKKEIPRKDMVAASRRGRSHAIEGKPRDDDFALYFDEQTEWYIMAVADGAGSAKFSRAGSQIACQTAIETSQEKIAARQGDFEKFKSQEQRNEIGKILQEIIGNAVFQAYKAIEKEAKDKERPVKDYATTLLLSFCKKFDYGWFIGAWWVGDGGLGIYRQEPEYLKIMGEPDGGEFAGQTRFLTMPEIIKDGLYNRMYFEVVDDFTALILMTDGVTDPKFETDANLNKIEKWHELWDDLNGKNEDNAKVDFIDDNEQAAGQLLNWLDFWSKGNHDDRTIAILF